MLLADAQVRGWSLATSPNMSTEIEAAAQEEWIPIPRPKFSQLLIGISPMTGWPRMGVGAVRATARRNRRSALVGHRPGSQAAGGHNNRVDAGRQDREDDPKSETSRRELPLPDRLVSVLKAAKPAKPANGSPSAMVRGSTWCATRSGSRIHPRCCRGTGAKPSRRQGLRHIKLHARPAHLRHADAPSGCPGRGDRGLDRTRGRQPDQAAVCSQPVCCTAGRGSEFG